LTKSNKMLALVPFFYKVEKYGIFIRPIFSTFYFFIKKKLIPEKVETKILKIMLPKELFRRIGALCAEKEITI